MSLDYPATPPVAGGILDALSVSPWRELGEGSAGTDLAAANSRFLHVVEQGARVRRTGARVQVVKQDTVLLDVPAFKLQGVLLFGNVQFSTQCLKTLLAEDVWVGLFTRNGRYRGRLQPPAERGGRVRRLQWQRSQDAERCLALARTLVGAKLSAQRGLARQYARNYPGQTLKRPYAAIRELADAAASAPDLAVLRGLEGAASRAYFELFRSWNRSDLPFDRRQKRPARPHQFVTQLRLHAADERGRRADRGCRPRPDRRLLSSA